jgi:hypothetical protein
MSVHAPAHFRRAAQFREQARSAPYFHPQRFLHGHFHLARRDDLRLDDPLGIEVFHPNLFSYAAIRQSFARHTHAERTAAGGNHHLVALGYDFGLFEMDLRQDLIGDRWSGQFLPDRLIHGGEVTLADQADVSFAQHDVTRLDNARSLERPSGSDDVAKQAHLSGYEDSPGGGAVATDLDRNPANRDRRTLQSSCQFLVAHRHTQARIELIDLDLVATLSSTAR